MPKLREKPPSWGQRFMQGLAQQLASKGIQTGMNLLGSVGQDKFVNQPAQQRQFDHLDAMEDQRYENRLSMQDDQQDFRQQLEDENRQWQQDRANTLRQQNVADKFYDDSSLALSWNPSQQALVHGQRDKYLAPETRQGLEPAQAIAKEGSIPMPGMGGSIPSLQATADQVAESMMGAPSMDRAAGEIAKTQEGAPEWAGRTGRNLSRTHDERMAEIQARNKGSLQRVREKEAGKNKRLYHGNVGKSELSKQRASQKSLPVRVMGQKAYEPKFPKGVKGQGGQPKSSAQPDWTMIKAIEQQAGPDKAREYLQRNFPGIQLPKEFAHLR